MVNSASTLEIGNATSTEVMEKIIVETTQLLGLSAAWLTDRAGKPPPSWAPRWALGDPARPRPAVLGRRRWPAGRSLVDLGCRTQVVHSDQRDLDIRQGRP